MVLGGCVDFLAMGTWVWKVKEQPLLQSETLTQKWGDDLKGTQVKQEFCCNSSSLALKFTKMLLICLFFTHFFSVPKRNIFHNIYIQ